MAIELTPPPSTGGGGGGVTDPLVPEDGTQNVTGAFRATGDITSDGDVNVGGVVLTSDGSISDPAFGFTSDPDTGAYLNSTGTYSITAGGANRFSINASVMTTTVGHRIPVGAVGAPTLHFTGDADTGIWSPGDDTAAISTGGTEAARWNSSQQTLVPNGSVDAPSYAFANATDYGLYSDGSTAVSVSTGGPAGNLEALRFFFGGRTIVPSGSLMEFHNHPDGASDTEEATFAWVNDTFQIATDADGAGQFRNIVFDVNGGGITVGENGRHTINGSASGAAGFSVANDNNAFIFQSRLTNRNDTPAFRVVGSAFSTDYNASSGNQIGLQFDTDINQTGTASYEALKIDITETSVGSGDNRLITGVVDSSEVFGLTPAGQILATDGTAGIPTYAFLGDVDTGAYRISADEYGITTSGTLRMQVGGSFVKTFKATGSARANLTDNATIVTDASESNVFKVELEGNRTLANPDYLQDGFTYMWIIQQDGTGSRTLTYGDKFKFPSGITPTLTTTVSGIDTLSCVYDGDRDILLCNLQNDYS